MAHHPARFATLIAGALLGSIAASSPAQDIAPCQDDYPPNGNPATCSSLPACPTTAASPTQLFFGAALVHYYKADVGPCNTDNTCDSPYASCRAGRCKVDMLGELYRPPDPSHPGKPNSTPAPAVILVPGSTACSPNFPTQCVYSPEQFCEAKARFLDLGYVVLEAFPPGYGVDLTHNSTGLYISDFVTKQLGQNAPCAANHPQQPGPACSAYDLRDEGLSVISHAIPYLGGRTFVAKDTSGQPRVAVIGHSLGGIRTIGLNTVDFGQAAVVDISAGSESWCPNGVQNLPLDAELDTDVSIGTRPIYFLQPRNDVNIEPTVELSHTVGQLKRPYEATIFPYVRDSSGNAFTFGDWAHICFVTDQKDVDRWVPSVADFIQRYGVK